MKGQRNLVNGEIVERERKKCIGIWNTKLSVPRSVTCREQVLVLQIERERNGFGFKLKTLWNHYYQRSEASDK